MRVCASEYNAIETAIKEDQDAYYDIDAGTEEPENGVVDIRKERGGPVLPQIIEKLNKLGKALEDLGVIMPPRRLGRS